MVRKPIGQVFELISDIANYTKWVPSNSRFFIETEITSELKTGLGVTYTDRLRGFITSFGEITIFRPTSEIKLFEIKTFCGIRIFEADFGYQLERMQGDTEVHHVAFAKPCGLFKLLSPVIYLIVNSERNLTCNAIKAQLENPNQAK